MRRIVGVLAALVTLATTRVAAGQTILFCNFEVAARIGFPAR